MLELLSNTIVSTTTFFTAVFGLVMAQFTAYLEFDS